MKHFTYIRLKKAVTKKAEKFYNLKGLECTNLQMEGFFDKDILLMTVFFQNNDLKHIDQLKLSEHKENLNLFLGQIEKQIENVNGIYYSRIFINFAERFEKIEIAYKTISNENKKITITQKY